MSSSSVCIVTNNEGWPIVVAQSKEEAREYVEEETEYEWYNVCHFEEDSDGFESII